MTALTNDKYSTLSGMMLVTTTVDSLQQSVFISTLFWAISFANFPLLRNDFGDPLKTVPFNGLSGGIQFHCDLGSSLSH